MVIQYNCFEKHFVPQDATCVREALDKAAQGEYCASKGYAAKALALSILNVPGYLVNAPCRFTARLFNHEGIKAALKGFGSDLLNALKSLALTIILVASLAVSIFVSCFFAKIHPTPFNQPKQPQTEKGKSKQNALPTDVQTPIKSQTGKMQESRKAAGLTTSATEAQAKAQEAQHQQAQAQLQQAQAKVKELSEKLEFSSKEMEKLKSAHAVLTEAHQKLETEKKIHNDKGAAQATPQSPAHKVTQPSEQQAALTAKCAQLEQAKGKLNDEIAAGKAQIEALQLKLLKAAEKEASLEKQIQTQKQTILEINHKLNQAIEGVSGKVETAQAAIVARLTDTFSKTDEIVQSLTAKLSEAEEQLRSSQAEKQKLEAERKKDAATLTTMTEMHKQEIARHEKAYAVQFQENKQFEQRAIEAEKKYAAAQKALERSQAEKPAGHSGEDSSLHEAEEEARAELVQLQQQTQELSSKKASLEARVKEIAAKQKAADDKEQLVARQAGSVAARELSLLEAQKALAEAQKAFEAREESFLARQKALIAERVLKRLSPSPQPSVSPPASPASPTAAKPAAANGKTITE